MILLSFQKLFFEFFTSISILFSHTSLSFLLLYSFSKDPYFWVIFGDQDKKITKCSNPLYWEVVEVRPRQPNVLVCVVLAGTSEGLPGPKVLEGARYRYCGTKWSYGIVIVKILYSVEGGDVEQVCSNVEINLPCLRLLSLSLTCLYILHANIVFIFICLRIVC